jgi:HSP20 family protein
MLVRYRSPFSLLPRAFPFERPFSLFDDAFEQITRSLVEAGRALPVVDASWSDGSLVLTVDLPGVPSDAVTVEVVGRGLRMAVDTDELKWERTMQLGTGVDPEKVTADYADGRLTVTVGATEVAERRAIPITTHKVEEIEAATETAATETPATEADAS